MNTIRHYKHLSDELPQSTFYSAKANFFSNHQSTKSRSNKIKTRIWIPIKSNEVEGKTRKPGDRELLGFLCGQFRWGRRRYKTAPPPAGPARPGWRRRCCSSSIYGPRTGLRCGCFGPARWRRTRSRALWRRCSRLWPSTPELLVVTCYVTKENVRLKRVSATSFIILGN